MTNYDYQRGCGWSTLPSNPEELDCSIYWKRASNCYGRFNLASQPVGVPEVLRGYYIWGTLPTCDPHVINLKACVKASFVRKTDTEKAKVLTSQSNIHFSGNFGTGEG
jgi:hypothetical protein